jgi:hypothetical protein
MTAKEAILLAPRRTKLREMREVDIQSAGDFLRGAFNFSRHALDMIDREMIIPYGILEDLSDKVEAISEVMGLISDRLLRQDDINKSSLIYGPQITLARKSLMRVLDDREWHLARDVHDSVSRETNSSGSVITRAVATLPILKRIVVQKRSPNGTLVGSHLNEYRLIGDDEHIPTVQEVVAMVAEYYKCSERFILSPPQRQPGIPGGWAPDHNTKQIPRLVAMLLTSELTKSSKAELLRVFGMSKNAAWSDRLNQARNRANPSDLHTLRKILTTK